MANFRTRMQAASSTTPAAEATPVAPQATAPIAPQMVAVPVAAPDNENNG